MALGAVSMIANPASAQSRSVVVELFTSQGCSSCPPADELLRKLAGDPDIIALAYHVDYWDYLGWKDTFGARANTVRQHNYVGQTNREWIHQRMRGKFTPEIVVQGTDSLIGHNGTAIGKRINAHLAEPDMAKISMQIEGSDLMVTLTPIGSPAPDMRVLMVGFLPEETVKIKRGENAGKSVVYANIVSSFEEVAKWQGKEPLNLKVSNFKLPIAVLLQSGLGGPIVAAHQLTADPS